MGNGQSVRYDLSGNTVSRQKNERLHYNSAGRLAHYQRGAKVMDYTYNAYGQRTMNRTRSQAGAAADGRDTVLYHYDRQGRLIMESDATGRPLVDYVWMDNRPVLQTVYDGNPTAEGTRTYLLTDHSGTPLVGLNDQQQIVWRWDDGGFGEEKADEDPYGDGHKVTINLRFPGQYYDKESGLHYNRYRYYDPEMGRYITSAPIGLAGGINTYSYVYNNPLKYIDPMGLAVGDWWDFPANFDRAKEIAREELSKRPSAHNDPGDAQRHSEWMRRTIEETNRFTAWASGTGHEITGLFKGQPLQEALMDLHNNSVGRDAGAEGVPIDPKDLWVLPLEDNHYNPYSRNGSYYKDCYQ